MRSNQKARLAADGAATATRRAVCNHRVSHLAYLSAAKLTPKLKQSIACTRNALTQQYRSAKSGEPRNGPSECTQPVSQLEQATRAVSVTGI